MAALDFHAPPAEETAAIRRRKAAITRRIRTEVLREFGLDRLSKIAERALVTGGQGTGKSRTAAEAVAALEGGVVIWWLVPTLDKAEEQAAEYRALATKASMTARVVRGRGAPDPRNPDEAMCPRHEVVTRAAQMGVNVQPEICDGGCPLRFSCGFQRQLNIFRQDPTGLFLMAHDYLWLPCPAPRPDILIVDESVIAKANAMLMLHDPSGLVMGTAADMRGMADALDKMKAGMVAAYRDKSGRDDAEIEALMVAETWLSAEEALRLGFADRVEQPVRMAAHFDLSRFHNTPPQLAASLTSSTPQEDAMSDPNKTRKPDTAKAAAAPGADTTATDMQPAQVVEAAPPVEPAAPATTPVAAAITDPAPQPTAQVIDLDGVRAEERRATLAYVTEVHELCAIAGRGDLAAGFIARAAPVNQIRRALLEARAAEDEATAIRSQVLPTAVEPAQPAIDTAAIYAARNQNAH